MVSNVFIPSKTASFAYFINCPIIKSYSANSIVVYELIADEVCSTELAISHIRPELVSKITLLFYYIDNYCIRRFICHGNILTV